MRESYYRTSDGLQGLVLVVNRTADPKLAALVTQLDAALEATRRHLDENYTWD